MELVMHERMIRGLGDQGRFWGNGGENRVRGMDMDGGL